MRYLFGDSTEFPVQRNFLDILNKFVDTSIKTITIENNVFSLKDDIRDRRKLKNSVLDEMDKFLLAVENAISDAVSKSKEQVAISQYADKSRHFLKNFIEDGKKDFTEEIFQEIEQFEQMVKDADEDNRKILEFFFLEDPLTINSKKFIIKVKENKEIDANVNVDYDGNISCIFDIVHSNWKNIKVRDFIEGVEIPVRMKKPFLRKDLEPEIINIDDYILDNITLSEKEDKDIEVVFKKLHNSPERVRMKMNFANEYLVEIHYAEDDGVEKNIKAIPELSLKLNILRLQELGEKLVEQIEDLYSEKTSLKNIYLEDKDVLEENLIFELAQRIAERFSLIVVDIMSHSPLEEELSIKEEDEKGERKEIYIKKSEIMTKFMDIKEKGDKLVSILNLNI